MYGYNIEVVTKIVLSAAFFTLVKANIFYNSTEKNEIVFKTYY